jgi:ABC-type sugar transport system substrate-binding protein
MKRFIPALAFGLLAFSACLAQAADMKIGAIYLDSQGFYAGVRKGVQDEAASQGQKIELLETNASGDVSKESAFVDTLIAANVNAIILSAVSANGSVQAVRRAYRAHIPVVCYNTCIDPSGMKKYVAAYAVGDPFTFGERLGDAAARYFDGLGNKNPTFAVLNCEFVEVCVQRRKGFEKALMARLPGAKIVSNQEGTVLDKAMSVGQTVLTANPNLDAFFGESGGATLGAVKAVRSQGRVGKTVVFGSDMTVDIAQELVNHQVLKGEVDVSGKAIGRAALKAALLAIQGKEGAATIIPVPIDLYTTPAEATAWLDGHKDGLP